ncbi:MAG: GNAT family N-acetyltransferase [SAR202 cluster bacterium]|nr:GNAT family N-acetyltransferase [SAR202 cluster bacterium]
MNTLFLTPLWQRAWLSTLGHNCDPILLALHREDQLIGIAPLAHNDGTITFLGDTNLFDYQDFVVRDGDEEYFYHTLVEYLGHEDWQSLEFPSLREDSPTTKLLPGLARERGWTVHLVPQDVSPSIALSPTWDEYLAGLSKKDRHELRRKFRRLDNHAWHRLYSCRDTDNLAASANSFFELMRGGTEAKRQFLTPEREAFFNAIITETARAEMLKLYFLEVEGKQVAAALCFDYAGSRFLYNSGFNTTYSSLSVGLLVKAFSLQEAIQDQLKHYDFLRGDEHYKYQLGATRKAIYRLCITR